MVFSVGSFIISAQNIDSLKLALKNTKEDTVKVNILIEIIDAIDDDSIWPTYNDELQKISEKLLLSSNEKLKQKGKKSLGEVFNNLGYLYDNQKNISKGLEYYYKALKIAEETNDKPSILSILNNIGLAYEKIAEYTKALNAHHRCLKIGFELGNKKNSSESLYNIAMIYINLGKVQTALKYLNNCLLIQEQIGDKKEIANTISNIAYAHNILGNLPLALDCWSKSLKLSEAIDDKNAVATNLNNIGFVYSSLNDPKALDYFKRSLKIQENLNDKRAISYSLNNIGLIYYNKRDYVKALDYYNKGLQSALESDDEIIRAGLIANIGDVYSKQGKYDEAMINYHSALKISKETKEKQGVTQAFGKIGRNYFRLAFQQSNEAEKNRKYTLAKLYADSSLTLAKEMGYPFDIKEAEYFRSKVDSATGNFGGAFEHFKQFIIYRDSINNEGNRKAGIRNQLNYEYEKKEAVIKEQQEKERAVAEEKNRFQKIVIFSVAFGLLLVIIFAVFILRSLKVTRLQKHVIEEKQKEILDSIRYAKRIQTSLLPTEKYIEKQLKS